MIKEELKEENLQVENEILKRKLKKVTLERNNLKRVLNNILIETNNIVI